MAVTAYRSPSTITEDTSVGLAATSLLNYANLANAGTPYAEVDWGSGTRESYRYKATNWNFAAEGIPAGSTIDGNEFGYGSYEVSQTDNLSTFEINMIQSDGAVITGTNRANTSEWVEDVFTEFVVGGPTDIWGYTGITLADVEDADFGIAYRFKATAGTTPDGFVGVFKDRVYYTPPAASAFKPIISMLH